MNLVIIFGRISSDISLKYTKEGTAFATFSVAYNRYAKDKKQIANFFKCKAWGRSAELLNQYFSKGERILIEGELMQESYTDKQGQNRNEVNILVKVAKMIDNKHTHSHSQPQAHSQPQPFEPFETMNDGIPF